MNIPGFTADASLYKTSRRYDGARTIIRAGESVYPAQLLLERTNSLGCFEYFTPIWYCAIYHPLYTDQCLSWKLGGIDWRRVCG